MERIVRTALMVLLIASFGVATGFIAQAVEDPSHSSSKEKAVPSEPQQEKAVTKESQAAKKATLALKKGSNNTLGIDLENSVPVRGVQFTMKGVKMTEVRTTSRTAGFMVKFNEETGIVILVSISGDEIPPGNGLVAEVIGEKVPGSEAHLSDIMIADRNRQLL